jgi:hypothetical protein
MIINTTKGLMDESLLEKREGTDEFEQAFVSWVEYWMDGELVHRSANIGLKGQEMNLIAGDIRG